MALQTVRMIVLLLVGPYIARWMTSAVEPSASNSEPAVPLAKAIVTECARLAIRTRCQRFFP